jgi:hypothetical protein
MGFTVAPLTSTMMEAVPEHRVGLASGINNAISRVAGLLAIAVLGVLLASVFNARLTGRLNSARVSAADRARVDAQRANLAGALLPARLERFVLGSYADAFHVVALACALLAASGAASAATLIDKRPTQRE